MYSVVHSFAKTKCNVTKLIITFDLSIFNLANNTPAVLLLRILLCCDSVQGQVSRRLRHFHYLEWPDNGVPEQLSLLNFVELVRDEIPARGGPIVVHCRSVGTPPLMVSLIP